MGRKKLKGKDKKVKISITVEEYQLEFLYEMGPTVSEAIRKMIDYKLRGGKR